MSVQLKAKGWYLCNVTEGRMSVEESGSLGVTLILQPTGEWDPTWVNEDGSTGNFVGPPQGDHYDTAYGTWYVVKKDGSVNDIGLEGLCRSGFWLDDLRLWAEPKPPIPGHCVIQMGEPEMYEGKARIKPNWLHDAKHRPGGTITKQADKEKLLTLDEQFGGKLRAAAASFKRPAIST